YERTIVWVPWQRPGFELALMLKKAVEEHPGCDGIILGGHGLFTWGTTQHDCYLNSVRTIDQMGEFIQAHERRANRPRFGGAAMTAAVDDLESAIAGVFPRLRGAVSSNRRVIGHHDASAEALEFDTWKGAEPLCALGTSCPDHFLRTRISPMFVPWDPATEDAAALGARIDERIATYREDYAAYYKAFAEASSPALRDSNPSVVVIPGLGLLGSGKDKREARITPEFFVNAIHVMQGANALEGDGGALQVLPQVRRKEQAQAFRTFHNYVALPRLEAFRIEYWALEEAKLQRMPPEREFSRKVAVIAGGGSGIGREVAIELARRGAHVVVTDQNVASAETAWAAARSGPSAEAGMALPIDLASRESVAAAFRAAVLQFGGVDIIVNTAAVYPTAAPSESVWAKTLEINVTSNYVLAQEAGRILK